MNTVPARIKDPLPAPVVCPFCQSGVEYTTNDKVYGQRHGWPMIYLCTNRQCMARIGCHPGTDIPLGIMADAPTRRMRQRAHDAIDPLWRKAEHPNKERTKVYSWLAGVLGVPLADCHIGMFDSETCQRVIDSCLKRELRKQA